MRDVPRVENLQRVDREDFEYATADVALEYGREMGEYFYANPGGTRRWIISGFGLDNPAVGQFRVLGGLGLLGYREKGVIKEGAFQTGGDTQKIVDVSVLADALYNVYVRFELVDGSFQNRVFWNPSSLEEFTQNTATRRVANWGLRLAQASPGAEWLKIGEVTVASGDVTLITDQRPLYFEGDVDASYAREWGGGSDRSVARDINGIKDLRTAFDALFKKVEEIQTGTNPAITTQRWYNSPLTGSLDDKLPLSGSINDSTRMRGDIVPRTADAGQLNIGDASRFWNAIFSEQITVDFILPAGELFTSKVGDGPNPFASGEFIDLDIQDRLRVETDALFTNDGDALVFANSLQTAQSIYFYDTTEVTNWGRITYESAGEDLYVEVGPGIAAGGRGLLRYNGSNRVSWGSNFVQWHANIYPGLDNDAALAIGTASRRVSNIHTYDITLYDDIVPAQANVSLLGTDALYFNTMRIRQIIGGNAINPVIGDAANPFIVRAQDIYIYNSNDVIPVVDLGSDLGGGASERFNLAYIDDVIVYSQVNLANAPDTDLGLGRLNRAGVIAAWGVLLTDGAGGVTIQEGYRVSAAIVTGTPPSYVLVTIDAPGLDGGGPEIVVQCQAMGIGGGGSVPPSFQCIPSVENAGGNAGREFAVYTWNPSSATHPQPVDAAASAFRINFIVFGKA